MQRIRSLAIPPAWTDVWICPHPLGHVQATGRDARGRKQYRYHPRWREFRDEVKYGRILAFASALTRLRARTDADLRRPGLLRNKVIAAVIQILERTLIRVGNPEYARDNQSFGLTTLRDRHTTVRGANVRFCFRGKSGVSHHPAVVAAYMEGDVIDITRGRLTASRDPHGLSAEERAVVELLSRRLDQVGQRRRAS